MCSGPRPFIPAAGIIRVQMIYLYNSQRCENVFNVRSGAGLAVADLDRVQALFKLWHTNNLRAQQNPQAVLTLWVLDALDSASGTHKEYTDNTAGLNPAGAVANNMTVAVKWTTGLRGRSFRGRTFHIGLRNDAILNGVQLQSGAVTSIQAAYQALLTALNAAATPDRLVITSYCSGGAWRPAAVSTNVSACTLEQNLDSMRRRLAGRGL